MNCFSIPHKKYKVGKSQCLSTFFFFNKIIVCWTVWHIIFYSHQKSPRYYLSIACTKNWSHQKFVFHSPESFVSVRNMYSFIIYDPMLTENVLHILTFLVIMLVRQPLVHFPNTKHGTLVCLKMYLRKWDSWQKYILFTKSSTVLYLSMHSRMNDVVPILCVYIYML